MTAYEKQLEARIVVLERQNREIRKQLGMDEAEILAAEREAAYDEAMDRLVKTGDATLLKAYLRKINGEAA